MNSVNVINKKQMADLFDRGYRKAASSFSDLVNKNVTIVNAEADTHLDKDDFINLIENEDNMVLRTELIGDLVGESYLILNNSERKAISDYCLETFANSNGSKLDEEAILKEVDNILSAAMITEFSNSLKVKTFGDVPRIIERENIENKLHADNNESYFLLSKAHFSFEDQIELNPKFLWRLDGKFLEKAREANS